MCAVIAFCTGLSLNHSGQQQPNSGQNNTNFVLFWVTPLDSLSVLKDGTWCVSQLLIESAGHFPRILSMYTDIIIKRSRDGI
jgi:hypothetical protein